ncbi:MAG: hypothetical protein V4615_17950 [Bacteroidota bacterium]
MFRLLLFFVGTTVFFGWMAGMAVYKILQLIFAVVAVIILLMVGNFLMVMLNKN